MILIILYFLGFLFFLAIFINIFLPNTVMPLLKYASKLKKGSTEQYVAYFMLMSLMAMDAAIIRYLTRFFPFSLLYKDTLGHAKNKPLRVFINKMEKYLKANNMPILIKSGDLRPPLTTLFAVPIGHYKTNKHEHLVKLEELLQKKFQTIFVRDNKTGFRILISTEILGSELKLKV